MRTSCINHPPKEPLIVVRRWQIELCEGNATAAALLSFFEYWHNIKLETQSRASRSNDIAEMHGDTRTQDEGLLQFHTEEELVSGIMIAKRDTIRKAIGYLKDRGFVSVHSNPNPRYAFDKTRYFLFHPDIINRWLDEKSALSNIRQSKSENQSRESENQSRESENQSAITEITSEITPETLKSGGEEKSASLEESGIPTNPSLPKQPCQPSNSINDKPYPGDKDSALPPCDNSDNSGANYIQSSAAKNDALFRRPKLEPWLDEPGPNGWKPDFVEFYRNHLSSTQRYLENLRRQATSGDARNSLIYLTKSDEGKAQIRNHWENYQTSLAPSPAAESLPTRYDPLEGTEVITPEQVRELREIANLARSQKK